ncbi:aryl-sulfate sulfotransferase [Granulicoccus phenolivorans]|uniref:aryl-sulfate sulfotransferase n=1 Tax=Granulicoccus phenolivorans TaxID=266854 RepID=UPI00047D9EA8|nr:aryl-sulfate sulfotransferase [Granulicoccus phenolivorans]
MKKLTTLLLTGLLGLTLASAAMGSAPAEPRSVPEAESKSSPAAESPGAEPRAAVPGGELARRAATAERINTGPVTSLTVSGADLTPAFEAGIVNYALWCQASVNPMTVTINGESTAVELVEGQPLIVSGGGSEYWLRCLPRDFPRPEVTTKAQVSDGWYVSSSHYTWVGAEMGASYAFVMDSHGTPVWYVNAPSGAINVQKLADGRLNWAQGTNPRGVNDDNPRDWFRNYDLSNATTTLHGPPDGLVDEHEYLELANGNVMWMKYWTRPYDTSEHPDTKQHGYTTVIDQVFEEYTPGGQLVHSWLASEHLDYRESILNPKVANPKWNALDPYHCNAVGEDPDANQFGQYNIIISCRNTSAVYLVERNADGSMGRVLWKLGSGQRPPLDPQTKHAVIQGTPDATGVKNESFSAQHDARIIPDGSATDDRVTVTLFDNHTQMPNGRARGAQYQLDLAAGTATLEQTWEDPDAQAPGSDGNMRYMGSFRRSPIGVPNENLLSFGGDPGSHGYTELNDAGEVLRTLRWVPTAHRARTDFPNYRWYKYAPDAFDLKQLRASANQPMLECNAPLLDTEAALAEKLGARSLEMTTALVDNGCARPFQRGTIFYSPKVGHAYATVNGIDALYRSMRAENSRLGYPTGNEVCRTDGCRQTFEHGEIHWSAAGTYSVYGEFAQLYARLGGPETLGYARSAEACGLTRGGCWQAVGAGFLVWSPGNGAHLTKNAIRARWVQLGAENGQLGYPTTEEQCTLVRGGCWQGFEGGAIVWSPQTGAYESQGAIRGRWLQLGAENGRLGYPSGPEQCGLTGGGCWQAYQGGVIVWAPGAGAWESVNAIRAAWLQEGAENGRLGYPTSGETCSESGCVQWFQRGWIMWTPSGGTTVGTSGEPRAATVPRAGTPSSATPPAVTPRAGGTPQPGTPQPAPTAAPGAARSAGPTTGSTAEPTVTPTRTAGSTPSARVS